MALDGIVYVNDHPAPRGTGKHAALTVDEFDDNFFALYERIVALEGNPSDAVSISNITVNGSQMLISMSDGVTTYGPFTLPIASFVFRGDWTALADYNQNDLVSVPEQGLFFVRLAHTAAAVFDPAATDGSGNALYLLVFGEDVYIYDVGFFYPGKPGQGIDTDGYIAAHQFIRPVVLPATAPASVATLRIAPTAALSFPLFFNGAALGSIDFAIGSTAGTFTVAADQPFAVNDVIAVGPPVAADATAKDLTITLAFTRTF
jgi:hypothetical protein